MTPLNKRLNYMVRSGLLMFCLGGLLRLFVHPTPRLSASLIEGVIGFLYGLSVVLLCGGVVLKNRNRRCASEPSPLEQK